MNTTAFATFFARPEPGAKFRLRRNAGAPRAHSPRLKRDPLAMMDVWLDEFLQTFQL